MEWWEEREKRDKTHYKIALLSDSKEYPGSSLHVTNERSGFTVKYQDACLLAKTHTHTHMHTQAHTHTYTLSL